MNASFLLAGLGLLSAPALAQGGKPGPFPRPGFHPQDHLMTVPASPSELAEGKRRLDSVIAAHGGEAFLKLSSVTFTGKGEASLPGAGEIAFESVKLTYAMPDRVRLDSVSAFGTISQVSPGRGKKPFMVMAGQVQDAPVDFRIPDPTAILREVVERNLAVRPVSDRQMPGFELPDEAGKPTTTLYFDAEKKLVRRIVLKNKQGELTVSLDAYKTTKGVSLPGKLAVFQGKDPLLSLTFSKAVVNPTLAESFFDPPKNSSK